MLGLLHMALAHVRNIEIFALLMPLVVLTPLASQFALQPARFARMGLPAAFIAVLLIAARRLDLGCSRPMPDLRRRKASRRPRPSMC